MSVEVVVVVVPRAPPHAEANTTANTANDHRPRLLGLIAAER
ncbi:MAG: hypothetical protein R3A52_32475 [Polyangiales bacterium]